MSACHRNMCREVFDRTLFRVFHSPFLYLTILFKQRCTGVHFVQENQIVSVCTLVGPSSSIPRTRQNQCIQGEKLSGAHRTRSVLSCMGGDPLLIHERRTSNLLPWESGSDKNRLPAQEETALLSDSASSCKNSSFAIQ